MTKLTGNPKKVISELLAKFIEIAGAVAIISAKTSIIMVKDKYPDLDLPGKLK